MRGISSRSDRDFRTHQAKFNKAANESGTPHRAGAERPKVLEDGESHRVRLSYEAEKKAGA